MALFKLPVTVTYAQNGGPGANVWHLRVNTTPPIPAGDVDSISTWVKTFYTSLASLYLTTTKISFDGTFTTVDDPSPSTVAGTPWTVTGTGASGSMPTSQAIVVGWRTSLATRSGHGRTFLGPLWVNALDPDGTPKDTVLATVRAAAATLISSSSGAGNGALGVYSPKDHVLRDFTGAVVHDTFAVLRSRRD